MQRRSLLGAALAAPAAGIAFAAAAADATGSAATPINRSIGARAGRSAQALPVIGMGTWQTFDIATSAARERCRQVLLRFFEAGGGVIDSSPMYGRAERVVGELLPREAVRAGRLFAATKVWTPFDASGPAQHADSLALWQLPRIDLQQVHNLLNTAAHLKTLRAARERGEVRYIGVTTSHGRRHDELLALMKREPLDAIQLTYNLADTSAEPLIAEAQARGIAVIANRPFDGGALPRQLAGQPLPGWAAEIGCAHWSQVLLKWIVAHPGVSCAIPATGDPAHMTQNMVARLGPLPDAGLRRRIQQEVRERV